MIWLVQATTAATRVCGPLRPSIVLEHLAHAQQRRHAATSTAADAAREQPHVPRAGRTAAPELAK